MAHLTPSNPLALALSRKARSRPVAVVHRLALYNNEEQIVNIISQTDIVRCAFVYSVRASFPADYSVRCAGVVWLFPTLKTGRLV